MPTPPSRRKTATVVLILCSCRICDIRAVPRRGDERRADEDDLKLRLLWLCPELERPEEGGQRPEVKGHGAEAKEQMRAILEGMTGKTSKQDKARLIELMAKL